MLFTTAAIITAFFVGFAMKRSGLCTYAAVLQIVNQRRFSRLLDFLGATAWATVIVVLFSWWFPTRVMLSGYHDQMILALFGGMLLGLGAYLNRGCVFGTFVQLVSGNLTYLATLAGMSTGIFFSYEILVDITPEITQTSWVNKFEYIRFSWLFIASLFGVAMLFQVRSSDTKDKSIIMRMKIRPRLEIFFMLILGAGGGLLFATISGWDFAAVLTKFTLNTLSTANPKPENLAILCTLAMITGGIVAAVTTASFDIQTPRFIPFMGCFIGGALMGIAALIIPGGNDGMLLKGTPSLAPHAIVGFLFMIMAMLLLLKFLPNNRGYSL